MISYFAKKSKAGIISIEIYLKLPFAHSIFENSLAESDKDYLSILWSKRNFSEINKFFDLGWWKKPASCKSVIYCSGKIRSIHKRITLQRFVKGLYYSRIDFNRSPDEHYKILGTNIEALEFKEPDKFFDYISLDRLHGGDLRTYCSLYFYLRDLHKNTRT